MPRTTRLRGNRLVGMDGNGAGGRSRGEPGKGEGDITVTENERRAQDLLSVRDLLIRAGAAVGLIAVALLALLVA